jgi:hypothetical protein
MDSTFANVLTHVASVFIIRALVNAYTVYHAFSRLYTQALQHEAQETSPIAMTVGHGRVPLLR